MSTVSQVLEGKNLRQLSKRITAAGYPITQPALYYWMTGKVEPRLDRLTLAEKVTRENDPEVANILAEIISALG